MSLVAGEYGKTLRVGAGLDLTGATQLTLDVRRPDYTSFQAQKPDVAVGTTQVLDENGNELMASGEYATYTVKSGDLTVDGSYLLQLTADFGAGQKLKTVTRTVAVAKGAV